jgi:hypothetical protein
VIIRSTFTLYLDPPTTDDDPNFAFFPDGPDDETDPRYKGEDALQALLIPAELFHEMGDPDVVTVTVEPGDRLNQQ